MTAGLFHDPFSQKFSLIAATAAAHNFPHTVVFPRAAKFCASGQSSSVVPASGKCGAAEFLRHGRHERPRLSRLPIVWNAGMLFLWPVV